jgi:hypothetical protein
MKRTFLPLVFALVSANSFAGVLTDAISSTGNQDYSGTVGLDFDVASKPLLVTSLGAFDSDADGFAAGTTIKVSVYDRNTMAIVGSPVTFTSTEGTLVGAWREKSVAPFMLAANGQYSIVAEGFNANDGLFNSGFVGGNPSVATNSVPGLLTFVGPRYGTAGEYPIHVDGGPNVRYLAGNLGVQAVPEPTSMAALGLGALGILKRRKKA